MRSRDMTTHERRAVDDAWAQYLKTAETARLQTAEELKPAKAADRIRDAWSDYQSALSALNVGATLAGYRVFASVS